jgi:hypothetical protein
MKSQLFIYLFIEITRQVKSGLMSFLQLVLFNIIKIK